MSVSKKRMISGLLAILMVWNMIPAPVFALDGDVSGELCPHHPEHTSECGYIAASQGTECTHSHTESCFDIIENCIHQHIEGDCAPAEKPEEEKEAPEEEKGTPEEEKGTPEEEKGTPEEEKGTPEEEKGTPEEEKETPEEQKETTEAGTAAGNGDLPEGIAPAVELESVPCGHVCTEGSGCLERVLKCSHQHDAACGYVPMIEESPCTYVCTVCNGQPEEPGVVFPEAPNLPESPEPMEDGEVHGELYGQPSAPMDMDELIRLQTLSLDALIQEDPNKKIEDEKLQGLAFIYVNGEVYPGGDLQVYEGDNFSYMASWSPNLPDDVMEWEDGSWFETELFQVPGLTLASISRVALNINGIKVGEYSLIYDKQSGIMTYKVVFNRYIQFFKPNSIRAYIQGSGSFRKGETGGPIREGELQGTLTINPRPSVPGWNPGEGGVGWKPQTPAALNNNVYPFGKGVKWTSREDPNASVNEIEWRAVFLEQIQKLQLRFREAWEQGQASSFEFPETGEYVIIEDTLDPNQRFLTPTDKNSTPKYGEAPFFLELPVMVPGTGNILNSTRGVGNGEYDGPGEIHTYIPGGPLKGTGTARLTFQMIDGYGADTAEEIQKVQSRVKETAFSWTVTTDPITRQQTLLINAGRLGSEDPSQGITWDQINNYDRWPTEELHKAIRDCDNKIAALQNGMDSPIALMEQRAAYLYNLLNRAVVIPQPNEGDLAGQVNTWYEDYAEWRKDPRVSYLEPLAKKDENGKWELIRPLPDITLIEALKGIHVDSDGKTLEETVEYQNYIKSLTNLQADQRIYLDNRTQYGKDWEALREAYQCALAFYEAHDGIYGFVVKVRTESVNSAATTYSNDIRIELGDKKWSASDTSEVKFMGGIIGDYSLGNIVLQKTDAFYDTGDAVKDIQAVEREKAGLDGVEFRMYCGNNTDTPPQLISENLAHFLDKEASINGNTYLYTHTGDDDPGHILHGDVDKLVTEDGGKLVTGRIVRGHYHWLVETAAPEGYYRNPTPIQMEKIREDSVVYQVLPNVSRSVLLKKIDSFSKNPVKGAEFELFKLDGQKEIPIIGFTQRIQTNAEGKQHEGYWKATDGADTLKTNSSGELCIHGLDEGTYILRESNPAPGYRPPADGKAPEYRFTLDEELPENSDGTYDQAYHQLLTKDQPLTNEPGVAELVLTKTGISGVRLENAGFSLFRFTGSEAQWEEDPDRDMWWEAVDLNQNDSSYFQTKQVTKLASAGQNGWHGKDQLEVVLTDKDGQFRITNIPVGHYSISELSAPDSEYKRDYRSFYFTVNEKTVNTSVQLYTDPEQVKELKSNTLKNYKRLAQLALVKYDATDPAQTPPKIAGLPVDPDDSGKGWHYTEEVLQDPNEKGLQGAVYKLFMRRGASVGRINPDPAQINNDKEIIDHKVGFDVCVAMGETDEHGVLRLKDMKGKGGLTTPQGLNPEEYYMIEVKAPDGYLLDREPIHFTLTGDMVFGDLNRETPGLVMVAGNKRISYGVRLAKVDGDTGEDGKMKVGLEGAEFEVTQGGETLFFSGSDGFYKLASDSKEGDKTLVTGEDGMLTVVGLKPGVKYTFTETQPPRGYQSPENPAVDITTVSSTQDGVEVDGVLFPEDIPQVVNQRRLGEVVLHKQEAETGEPLAGAEFTLYETVVEVIQPGDPDYDPKFPEGTRSYDVPVGAKTTDQDGNITFENLPWSKYYYIMETDAPDGYLLDQTKWMFSIGENSFTADGEVIPVQFPAVVNAKGSLGKAVLIKADEEDHTKRLRDAHFYLEKYMGIDADGREIWVGYGKGMYVTDDNGEIHFLLPQGRYKLSEMKAPDGYVLEATKELLFTIEKPKEGSSPEPVVIDEEGDSDGVVTNRQGEAGVCIQKTLGNSDNPIPGVTFRVGWEIWDKNPDTGVLEATYEPLYFIPQGGDNYQYTGDPDSPAATTELVTSASGMIYAMLPMDLKFAGNQLASLCCWETDAPDGIQRNPLSHEFRLIEGIYDVVNVVNDLKPQVSEELAITIHKQEGKSKRGLAGAEFTLFWYTGKGEESADSHIRIGFGVTDEKGELVFNQGNVFFPLMAGETYHIVETGAPEGFVMNEAHHEVVLDADCFDENFRFTGAELNVYNYRVSGRVRLKKVATENPSMGLAGAEFELLCSEADGDLQNPRWEHYGEWRYITDEAGELMIEDLPYGNYRLIERSAPLGYLLDDPVPVLDFQITQDGQTVNLGRVENRTDPSERRDVYVRKVAAENHDNGLPGAEFELYMQGSDGEYHLRQRKTYVTDSGGSFVISRLPVGSYAIKEIKAPEGYVLPEQNMTYFAVRAEDEEIRLQIENSPSNGNGGNTVSVRKVWEDGSSVQRPDSVFVQLYCDGSEYGAPAELNAENEWSYTWGNLDSECTWIVDEAEVPEGYRKTVTCEGNTWTITNTLKSRIPTELNAPAEPKIPTDRVPHTGDSSHLSLWIALLCLSAVGFALVWGKTRIRRKDEKKE